MASADADNEALVQSFRSRLKNLILVEQLLDQMPSIEGDRRDLLKNKARTEGDHAAVDLLLDTVLQRPRADGWFREFVDALSASGFCRAADYMEIGHLPDPDLEEENDQCVRLIWLVSPSLVTMKTGDVCLHCFSEEIITLEDKERITAELTNNGNHSGARELLRRIVRRQPGWFSMFLKVLVDTEHANLYRELTGVNPDKDKKGSDAAQGAGPAVEQGPMPEEECPVRNQTENHLDLYNEGTIEGGVLQEGLDPSNQIHQTKEPEEPGGAGRGAERDIVLRDYQMDVARPALEGKNIIVCLPTGSGKTRVAVYITREHLDARRAAGRPGKVVVLVNKVPLVEQHYSKEFGLFLKHRYKVEGVSGNSQLKISFAATVKKNDVIICTAQILENFLGRSDCGEDEGVRLSDLTLMVIDECHHTQKAGVYNNIMMRYLKQKHRNYRLRKEQKEPLPIPQILGLTASPGVGGATAMKKAEEHILRICANLDACKIMTRTPEENKKEQLKKVATVEERKKDPFGEVIKNIMSAIHAHVELYPTCDLGSQNYEQWVVQKERNAAKEENQKVRVCAEHLRQYNGGLELSNTIRMCDAFSFLNKYQEEEMKRKVAPEGEEPIHVTDTERFLFKLFRENKEELQRLAKLPEFENKSLSELRAQILKEFTSREEARGIIFTKTRRSAIALSQWVKENGKFDDVGVKANYIIGGGEQSVVKPMTSAEQHDVLNKFRNGQINLLIATTVAEEGLDIPQCNFVIRYGLVTNEISMIQAQGRGRAEDSSYTLVEVEGSGVAEKETVNEYRKDMMGNAIAKIMNMNQEAYDKQMKEFQLQAIMQKKVQVTKKEEKRRKSDSPAEVQFSCRSCNKHVCGGEDIEIIEEMHRVNVSKQFCEHFIKRENTSLQERLLDYDTNWFIVCKRCGQRWGSMMLYRGIEFPCLHVKNFLVTYKGKKLNKCTNWRELAVRFPALDYATHASNLVESSDEEEEQED